MLLEDGPSDYSDYLGQLSNLNRIGALFAGFDFTVMTLLLTRLTDPSRLLAQIILYAMSVLFLVLVYWVGWTGMLHLYLCRRVPPNSPQLKGFAVLSFALYIFICVPLFLMFFLWELHIPGGRHAIDVDGFRDRQFRLHLEASEELRADA